MRSFFLTIFSIICFTAAAQVDDFQADILDYLSVNGTQQQYGEAYDEMFIVLRQHFESANVPENVWTDLKADRTASLEEIVNSLTFAYRKHFTQEEINEMANFYKTDAARKMVDKSQGPLTKADNRAIDRYLESEIGQKVELTRPQLSADVSEISSYWSRDLFSGKMEALLKLGYLPKQ